MNEAEAKKKSLNGLSGSYLNSCLNRQKRAEKPGPGCCKATKQVNILTKQKR